MNKVIIFGSGGQLGKALTHDLSKNIDIVELSKKDANFLDLDNLKKIISDIRPKVIINAAAYTKVDDAEINQKEALHINYKAVETISQECNKINSLLIHYSSDYVFSGEKEGAYTEKDKTKSINFYGKSKLEGERAIQKTLKNHIIIRTSWVMSSSNNNFLKTIYNLAKTNEYLEVVNDQFSSPTSVNLLSSITTDLLNLYEENLSNKDLFGIYHVSSIGKTSWFEYARHIVNEMNMLGIETKLNDLSIKPVATSSRKNLAQRPRNSYLDTNVISKKLQKELPYWKHEVTQVIKELKSKNA